MIRLYAALTTVLLCASSTPVRADIFNWDNGGTGSGWMVLGNWNPDLVGTPWTVSANEFHLNSGDTAVANSTAFAAHLWLNSGGTLQTPDTSITTPQLHLNGGTLTRITGGSGRTVTATQLWVDSASKVGNSTTSIFSIAAGSQLLGVGNLTKEGTGIVSFLNSVTYDPTGVAGYGGTVSLSEGTLRAIDYAAPIHILAGGSFDASENSITPRLRLQGGTLTGASTSGKTLSGAELWVDNDSKLLKSSSTLTIASTAIRGTGNLLKEGAGTILFSSSVTYDATGTTGYGGTVSVSEGILRALDYAAPIHLLAGGTFDVLDSSTTARLHLKGGLLTGTSGSSKQILGGIIADNDTIIHKASSTLNLGAVVSGNARLTKTGGGTLLVNPNDGAPSFPLPLTNTFTGEWLASEGILSFRTPQAIGVSTIVLGTGTARFDDSGSVFETTGSLAGNGAFQIGNSIASRTLTMKGSTINPGSGLLTAGTVTLQNYTNTGGSAHLVLAQNASSENAELVIDIVGDGNIAGTDYDQLVLANGNLSGLAFTDLTVKVAAGLTQSQVLNLAPLTIVSLGSGSISGEFANIDNTHIVTLSGGAYTATVNYNASSITLSNFQAVPEPSTWALLAIGSLALLLKRRK